MLKIHQITFEYPHFTHLKIEIRCFCHLQILLFYKNLSSGPALGLQPYEALRPLPNLELAKLKITPPPPPLPHPLPSYWMKKLINKCFCILRLKYCGHIKHIR